MNNIYTRNGYENRTDYLNSLADDYCVNINEVFELADLLGEDEDFDGLITALQDME